MIGFPALASTSMEQGRLATYPAFGVKTQSVPERFPYDIYAVPEIYGGIEERRAVDLLRAFFRDRR